MVGRKGEGVKGREGGRERGRKKEGGEEGREGRRERKREGGREGRGERKREGGQEGRRKRMERVQEHSFNIGIKDSLFGTHLIKKEISVVLHLLKTLAQIHILFLLLLEVSSRSGQLLR